MEALTKLIRKNKQRSTLVLTLLYLLPFIIIWYISRPDLSVMDAVQLFIGWYLLAVVWVWNEEKPEEVIQDLLFPAGYYNEIKHLVLEQKFIMYIDKKDSIVFKKETGKFRKAKIKIYRNKNHVWKIRAKVKYLREMEEYRIHYGHRMMHI